jgi:hypothetical protein
MSPETWEEAVKRGLDAAERQGKGRIASDEQLETIAHIHAAHLAEKTKRDKRKSNGAEARQ